MNTDEILDEIAEAEARLKALRAELQSRKSAEIIKMRAELEAKAAALGVTLHDVMAIKEKKQRKPAAPRRLYWVLSLRCRSWAAPYCRPLPPRWRRLALR